MARTKPATPTSTSTAEALGLHAGDANGPGSTEPAPWETGAEVADPDTQQVEVHAPEPAPPVEDAVVVDPNEAMQTLMEWCVDYMNTQNEDQNDVMAREVARILAADDMEGALAETAPLSGKDHPNKPFMLHGFRLTEGEYDEGWPVFASMDVTVGPDKVPAVINCGGPKVIAALMMLHKQGEYPYYVMLRAKKTRAGYTVLSLVDGRAIQG